jgi:hypothetical protein
VLDNSTNFLLNYLLLINKYYFNDYLATEFCNSKMDIIFNDFESIINLMNSNYQNISPKLNILN